MVGVLAQTQLKSIFRKLHIFSCRACSIDHNFKYNAALFYAEDVETEELYVQNEFLVKLENNWKYKLYLPARDAPIGSRMYEYSRCSVLSAVLPTNKFVYCARVINLDAQNANQRPFKIHVLMSMTGYMDFSFILIIAEGVSW